MKKLTISPQCARVLFFWLKAVEKENNWYHDFEARYGNTDAEAQYAGRQRLLRYLLYEVESNIPDKNGEKQYD